MGQKSGKTDYVKGSQVSKSQLLDCLQVDYDYNPWCSEGTLDEEV